MIGHPCGFLKRLTSPRHPISCRPGVSHAAAGTRADAISLLAPPKRRWAIAVAGRYAANQPHAATNLSRVISDGAPSRNGGPQ
jgi:hypothetical protein